MKIAIILAGGIGRRMNSIIPKQFLKINDIPIIIYTLNKFQDNDNVDAIAVVSVANYIHEVSRYKEKYSISKLKWVFEGGNTAQESIRNAIFELKKICKPNDIIMFHMSVSPLIDDEIIDDSFAVCKKFGNAIAADQSIFNLCKTDNKISSNNYYSKKDLVTLNMPWTIKYDKALWAYEKAYSENIETGPEAYLVSLLIALGETLYFSKDSQKNKLKLTTYDDVDMLEGYINLMKKRGIEI